MPALRDHKPEPEPTPEILARDAEIVAYVDAHPQVSMRTMAQTGMFGGITALRISRIYAAARTTWATNRTPEIHELAEMDLTRSLAIIKAADPNRWSRMLAEMMDGTPESSSEIPSCSGGWPAATPSAISPTNLTS